jgi:hypothetical protein
MLSHRSLFAQANSGGEASGLRKKRFFASLRMTKKTPAKLFKLTTYVAN